jgi:hypothetical protein
MIIAKALANIEADARNALDSCRGIPIALHHGYGRLGMGHERTKSMSRAKNPDG